MMNSKPGDLATKFISINGKPIMARRSKTYTQPLRDEFVKSNVEQPTQHDDGNPLMPMRQVQFGTKRGDVCAMRNSCEMNITHKDDGQRLTSDTLEDPNVCAMKPTEATPSSPQNKSFLNAVTEETKNPTNPKVNFRSLVNIEQVKNSDCVLHVEHLGQNYVSNTWSKFGFQKVMRDDDDVYYFKFTSMTGLEHVLEKGPWLIRNQPLILTKWSPKTLSKDKVTKVPVWVKVHKVPAVAYSEDGLSLIATQIGKPIMLDAFTSAMCFEPWGRLGFARALIEVTAEKELKHKVSTGWFDVVDGEGHVMADK
ncbi:hypothetical protein Tco_1386881 [Tanacetum coccineum]